MGGMQNGVRNGFGTLEREVLVRGRRGEIFILDLSWYVEWLGVI